MHAQDISPILAKKLSIQIEQNDLIKHTTTDDSSKFPESIKENASSMFKVNLSSPHGQCYKGILNMKRIFNTSEGAQSNWIERFLVIEISRIYIINKPQDEYAEEIIDLTQQCSLDHVHEIENGWCLNIPASVSTQNELEFPEFSPDSKLKYYFTVKTARENREWLCAMKTAVKNVSGSVSRVQTPFVSELPVKSIREAPSFISAAYHDLDDEPLSPSPRSPIPIAPGPDDFFDKTPKSPASQHAINLFLPRQSVPPTTHEMYTTNTDHQKQKNINFKKSPIMRSKNPMSLQKEFEYQTGSKSGESFSGFVGGLFVRRQVGRETDFVENEKIKVAIDIYSS
ncbi:hypothetical protein HK098_005242 [Nowakowskiella sp. JEL0407]|nr:hypothetical protein HK098_005242 [Nowakowskiella sp. JEL0407]